MIAYADIHPLIRDIDHTLSHLECFRIGDHHLERITKARDTLREQPISDSLVEYLETLLKDMNEVFRGEGDRILIRMTREKISNWSRNNG